MITHFKRAAVAGAAFIAIGSAAAMSLPVADAATTAPAVSHSAQHSGWWCRWDHRGYCPHGGGGYPWYHHHYYHGHHGGW